MAKVCERCKHKISLFGSKQINGLTVCSICYKVICTEIVNGKLIEESSKQVKNKTRENEREREIQDRQQLEERQREKQEKIKEAELLEKQKLEEYRLRLVEEISENYGEINLLFRSLISRYNYHYNQLESLGYEDLNDDVLTTYLIKFYGESIEVISIEEFNSMWNKEKHYLLLNKMFGVYKNFRNSEFIDEYIEDIDWLSADTIISYSLSNDYSWVDSFQSSMEDTMTGSEPERLFCAKMLKMKSIVSMYQTIVAIVKVLILMRNKNKLRNNHELYTIVRNLQKQFDDINEVEIKLMPIYEKFYSDTFGEIYSTGDILCLIETMRLKEQFNDTNFEEIFKCISPQIENLLNRIKEENSNNNMAFDMMLELYREFIYSINWADLTEDIEDYFLLIQVYIEKQMLKYLPLETIFENFYRYTEIKEILKQKQYNSNLEKEKERFLRGDFSLEQSIEKDRLEMININTGVDFEGYLNNVFSKLGYSVETTKATGDQGADLLITKDGIKTVVQAKYYTGSVGNKAVQEVIGAIKYYQADNAMVVTNSHYTKSAIELAEANNIALIDGDGLEDMKASIFNSLNRHDYNQMESVDEAVEYADLDSETIQNMESEEKYDYLKYKFNTLVNYLIQEGNEITLETLVVVYINIMNHLSKVPEFMALFMKVLENEMGIELDGEEATTAIVTMIFDIYSDLKE